MCLAKKRRKKRHKYTLLVLTHVHIINVNIHVHHTNVNMTVHLISFNIQALTVTMALKTATPFFCMTLQLMMMYHHAKFGYKRWSGSKDMVWIRIEILNICCDPYRDYSNPVFS